MSDKITMTWKDGRGKEQVREVNQIIDVRDFVGTPGYALLLVAANTALSVGDILRFFWQSDVGRSRSWISRRRWMFQQPDAVNAVAKANRDGNETRAVAIMCNNPTLSVRQLVHELKERGITRGREWVRMHRCDAVN
jgi:hypothetical protein